VSSSSTHDYTQWGLTSINLLISLKTIYSSLQELAAFVIAVGVHVASQLLGRHADTCIESVTVLWSKV